MSRQIVVASDMDGTLHINSKLFGDDVRDAIITDRWVGGMAVTGPSGWRDWMALSELSALVPVTGRSRSQFERMNWPGRRPRFSILSGGGLILVDGRPDIAWASHAAQEALRDSWSTGAVIDLVVESLPGANFAVPEGSVGLLCVTYEPSISNEALRVLSGIALERDWLFSVQGRKNFLQAPRCGKGSALAWLGATQELHFTKSAGDSLLDLSMLVGTAEGLVPFGSEAHLHGRDSGLTALAGSPRAIVEEIPKRLLDAISCL